MLNSEIIKKIFFLLPKIKEHHNPDSAIFQYFKDFLESQFSEKKDLIFNFDPFNELNWKYIKCGNTDSLGYFNIYQFIYYAFYFVNKKRYNIVFDIGSHIGGDSIVLDKFGFSVNSYEPDKESYQIQIENINRNQSKNIKIFNVGLSNVKGESKFIKVLNNSFANHIINSRENYGPTETQRISTITFDEIKEKPDLMKINIEGHEIKLIPSIDKKIWQSCDALIELHGKESVKIIYDYFQSLKDINIFSQKVSWKKVDDINDMPINYKEGIIFISTLDSMPW